MQKIKTMLDWKHWIIGRCYDFKLSYFWCKINDRDANCYEWLLKDLYPDLYVCLAVKDAYISEVLWMLEGGTVRVWDLRFYRAFED